MDGWMDGWVGGWRGATSKDKVAVLLHHLQTCLGGSLKEPTFALS